MEIHESAEDYLEAILVLSQEKGTVRSIDVVHHLGLSKPSISRAMGLLRENGYINTDKEGSITLTGSGREIAERIYERHSLISAWLVTLGVPPETAATDACRIEHDVSEETFARLKAHIQGS